MAHERLRPDFLFDEEKINQLKQIAPECFEDGKINFDTLKQNLGDWTVEDNREDVEHFGLFWPGKKEARRIASIPPEGTLEPVNGEGLKPDGTPDDDGQNDSKNIFIEGENLEVLKILQKSYSNKIKMIYIDPPYNTGNDFVYDDNFTEPVREYLLRTGQVDEEGQALTTNKKSDGRFHSKWLSMMYPRLRLARNLLTEDGVIFISIDDNEVHNLRALLNELFGEENFIAEFVWKSRQNKDNRNITRASIDHEYVLCYGKKIRGGQRDKSQYTNPDNDPRGPWASANMVGLLPEDQRPNCHYDLVDPATNINYGKPKMGWRYDQNTMSELIRDNKILWPKDKNGRPRRKKFLSELKENYAGYSSIIGHKVYTKDGTKEVEELFGFKAFDFPKPTSILEELIEQGCEEDGIILDFFAGSNSTGHAIFKLNAKKHNTRRFITVQIPEKINTDSIQFNKGFESLTKISSERLRLAAKETKSGDGFKYFTLKPSNFKKWFDPIDITVNELENKLDLFNSNPLVENSTSESLLFESILLEGFPLSSRIESDIKIGLNNIVRVSSSDINHSLMICLDNKLDSKLINNLVLKDNEIFICLDTAISNNDKLKLSDKGLIKTI